MYIFHHCNIRTRFTSAHSSNIHFACIHVAIYFSCISYNLDNQFYLTSALLHHCWSAALVPFAHSSSRSSTPRGRVGSHFWYFQGREPLATIHILVASPFALAICFDSRLPFGHFVLTNSQSCASPSIPSSYFLQIMCKDNNHTVAEIDMIVVFLKYVSRLLLVLR